MLNVTSVVEAMSWKTLSEHVRHESVFKCSFQMEKPDPQVHKTTITEQQHLKDTAGSEVVEKVWWSLCVGVCVCVYVCACEVIIACLLA